MLATAATAATVQETYDYVSDLMADWSLSNALHHIRIANCLPHVPRNSIRAVSCCHTVTLLACTNIH
jgi:hypothetical protein